jgi:hypothetical protein
VAAALLVPSVLLNLIGDTFKPSAKWVSFGIAMLLSLLVAYFATEKDAMKWVVALFNGFLVYASAVGINQGAAGGARLGRRGGFRSWF